MTPGTFRLKSDVGSERREHVPGPAGLAAKIGVPMFTSHLAPVGRDTHCAFLPACMDLGHPTVRLAVRCGWLDGLSSIEAAAGLHCTPSSPRFSTRCAAAPLRPPLKTVEQPDR